MKPHLTDAQDADAAGPWAQLGAEVLHTGPGLEPDWAGPGFSTPYADPELAPEAG
jgi:hypothetical protein